MKKFAMLFSFIVLLNASAVGAETPAIGYVDLRKLLIESKIGQKNKAEMDKLIKEKEKLLASEEGKLQALQQTFQKDQLLMTDEQKQAKQNEFQEKAEAYKKLVNEAKQVVNKKDSEFASQSMVELKKIIAVLAKEMKLSLMLEVSESGILYAQDGMDLTQKVLERYDAKAK